MRKEIPALLILILAGCIVLIRKPSIHDSSLEIVKPVQSRDQLFTGKSRIAVTYSIALSPSPPPEWKVRFWELAGAPEWMRSQGEFDDFGATIPEDKIRDVLDELAMDQSVPAMMLADFLVRRWAEKSPIEAAQWAATRLGDNDASHDMFAKIMVPWAEKDMAGALAWIQQLPAGGNKTVSTLALAVEAAARKEAVTAINLIVNLPSGPERDGVLSYSAQQWATTDRNGAVAWINQIQDPVLREKMLGEVAINLGVADPFAAAGLIASNMEAGPVRDDAVVKVVRFWTASVPEKAAAWVEQFPEGELRGVATENLIDVWAKDDPNAASAWIATMLK